VAVAMVIRNLEASAEAVKEAEAVMAKRRKAMENRADSLRDYLIHSLLAADRPKVSNPYLTLNVVENAPAVVIDDPNEIPAGYWRNRPPPAPEVDRVAIKTALLADLPVPGAHLERGMRLAIR
jgi:hypothetical protein